MNSRKFALQRLDIDASRWAWLAGVYEGEGSVSLAKYSLVIQVGQKDHWLLEEIHYWFGGLIFNAQAPRPDHFGGPVRQWRVTNARALLIIAGIRPWLSPRRCGQIDLALARYAVRLKGHFQARKTACKRGHPFTEANTYRPPGAAKPTHRYCRECHRTREARRRMQVVA